MFGFAHALSSPPCLTSAFNLRPNFPSAHARLLPIYQPSSAMCGQTRPKGTKTNATPSPILLLHSLCPDIRPISARWRFVSCLHLSTLSKVMKTIPQLDEEATLRRGRRRATGTTLQPQSESQTQSENHSS